MYHMIREIYENTKIKETLREMMKGELIESVCEFFKIVEKKLKERTG